MIKGDFIGALRSYSDAIKLDASNHVLFSNRSNAYTQLEKFDEALVDADKCVKLNASWAKGHARRGAALAGLKKHAEAAEAYEQAAMNDVGGAGGFGALASE